MEQVHIIKRIRIIHPMDSN